jgi:hypothetical protein
LPRVSSIALIAADSNWFSDDGGAAHAPGRDALRPTRALGWCASSDIRASRGGHPRPRKVALLSRQQPTATLPPMSLDHDFFLVSAGEHKPSDYARFIGATGATHVHDDLLRYMRDVLAWVPTLNPATRKYGHGLNFYGPTVILADGAYLAEDVFRAWAHLFSLGPEELVLTGPWTTVEDHSREGNYSLLRLPRAAVVATLERIADDCRRVGDSVGRFFLLHIGI